MDAWVLGPALLEAPDAGADIVARSAPVYLALGSASIVACAALVALMSRVPAAREHSTAAILVIVTIADAVYTLKYWVGAAAYLAGHTRPGYSFHMINDDCFTACMWGYGFATLSQLWNGAWAIEFLSLLYNPLRSTRGQMFWYHAFIWPATIALCIYLGASGANERAERNLCLFVSQGESFNFALEAPIYASSALAFFSLVYAAVRLLLRGTRATRLARCRLFARHLIFMTLFAGMWIWVLLSKWRVNLYVSAVFGGGNGFFLAGLRLVELVWSGALADVCQRRNAAAWRFDALVRDTGGASGGGTTGRNSLLATSDGRMMGDKGGAASGLDAAALLALQRQLAGAAAVVGTDDHDEASALSGDHVALEDAIYGAGVSALGDHHHRAGSSGRVAGVPLMELARRAAASLRMRVGRGSAGPDMGVGVGGGGTGEARRPLLLAEAASAASPDAGSGKRLPPPPPSTRAPSYARERVGSGIGGGAPPRGASTASLPSVAPSVVTIEAEEVPVRYVWMAQLDASLTAGSSSASAAPLALPPAAPTIGTGNCNGTGTGSFASEATARSTASAGSSGGDRTLVSAAGSGTVTGSSVSAAPLLPEAACASASTDALPALMPHGSPSGAATGIYAAASSSGDLLAATHALPAPHGSPPPPPPPQPMPGGLGGTAALGGSPRPRPPGPRRLQREEAFGPLARSVLATDCLVAAVAASEASEMAQQQAEEGAAAAPGSAVVAEDDGGVTNEAFDEAAEAAAAAFDAAMAEPGRAWDFSRALRLEMGLCVLSGLCQSVLHTEAHLLHADLKRRSMARLGATGGSSMRGLLGATGGAGTSGRRLFGGRPAAPAGGTGLSGLFGGSTSGVGLSLSGLGGSSSASVGDFFSPVVMPAASPLGVGDAAAAGSGDGSHAIGAAIVDTLYATPSLPGPLAGPSPLSRDPLLQTPTILGGAGPDPHTSPPRARHRGGGGDGGAAEGEPEDPLAVDPAMAALIERLSGSLPPRRSAREWRNDSTTRMIRTTLAMQIDCGALLRATVAELVAVDREARLLHAETLRADVPASVRAPYSQTSGAGGRSDAERGRTAAHRPARRSRSTRVAKPGRTGLIDHFRIYTFAEGTFAALRASAKLQAEQIVSVLDPTLLRDGVLKAHFSEGASSSLFCRSSDQTLIVKTVTSEEVGELLRLLPAYVAHLQRYPDSLLCRFYGLFAVQLPSIARVYFLCMGNALPVTDLGPGPMIFDLKGSSLGRVNRGGKAARVTLYQDLEFRRRFPRGLALLTPEQAMMGTALAGGMPVESPMPPAGSADDDGGGAGAGARHSVASAGSGFRRPFHSFIQPSVVVGGADADARFALAAGASPPLTGTAGGGRGGRALAGSVSAHDHYVDATVMSLLATPKKGGDTTTAVPRGSRPLEVTAAHRLVAQLRQDSLLLAIHGLMDYSLVMTMTPVTMPPSTMGDMYATPQAVAAGAAMAAGTITASREGDTAAPASDAAGAAASTTSGAAPPLPSPSAASTLPAAGDTRKFGVRVKLSLNHAPVLPLADAIRLADAAAALPLRVLTHAITGGVQSQLSLSSSTTHVSSRRLLGGPLPPGSVTRWSPLAVGLFQVREDAGGGRNASRSRHPLHDAVMVAPAAGGGASLRGGIGSVNGEGETSGSRDGGAAPRLELDAEADEPTAQFLMSPRDAGGAEAGSEAAMELAEMRRTAEDDGGGAGEGGRQLLFVQLGVVDVLQAFTLRKRVERFNKTTLHRLVMCDWSAVADISAVDPVTYQARFARMVERVFAPASGLM